MAELAAHLARYRRLFVDLGFACQLGASKFVPECLRVLRAKDPWVVLEKLLVLGLVVLIARKERFQVA
ncbi:MAG: hypothetical protein ABIY55_12085 [Kofleriaceae bacterium]